MGQCSNQHVTKFLALDLLEGIKSTNTYKSIQRAVSTQQTLAFLLGCCLLPFLPVIHPPAKATMKFLVGSHRIRNQTEVQFGDRTLHQGCRPAHFFPELTLLYFCAVLAVYVNVKLLSPKILIAVIELVLDILEAFCDWKRGKRVPRNLSPVTLVQLVQNVCPCLWC